MNIIVPSTPGRYRLTRTMTDELLYDPVKAAWIFFEIEFDAFQAAALRIQWFSYESEDHSGFGTGKTLRGWILCQLSGILIPDCVTGVIMQNMQSAKDNFWKYYEDARYMTPLFRAQLGRFSIEDDVREGKSTSREAGTWKRYFKGGGRLEMPAPDHVRDGEKLGSWEVNRMVIDESNKVRAMGQAVAKQLTGRVRLQPFNRDHPAWQNKVWEMGTAETVDRPGYTIYSRNQKEIAKGDPTIYTFGFCFKDFSGLKIKQGRNAGRRFKETIPDWKTIAKLKRELSAEEWIGEGLGCWALNVKRWYSDEAIMGGQVLGRARHLEPVLSRLLDLLGKNAFYFLGVDPARSKRTANDDGAIVVLRAVPRSDDPGCALALGDHEADYRVDPVFAQKIKNYGGVEWAGLIQELERDFQFARILIDLGGGGDFIEPELRKARAKIEGFETEVVPIVKQDDMAGEVCKPILHFLLRRDPGIAKLWPTLANARGGDVLKFMANSALRTAIEKGFVSMMPPHHERPRELLATWLPKRMFASILLSQTLKKQLESFGVEMTDKGVWKTTANGVPVFKSKIRDDFHDAYRNAYIAFKIWLNERDQDGTLKESRRQLCAGWTT